MDPQTQQTISDMQSRLASVEATVAQPTHYHNGYDSNQVAWSDLYQRKIWVRHTIYGTGAATAANYGTFFIVPITCLVNSIKEVHEVKGTDVSAVTITVEKLTGTTAPGAGVALLTTTISLKGTINTVVTGTLAPPTSTPTWPRSCAIGDRLALLTSGTLTTVSGVSVMVELLF